MLCLFLLLVIQAELLVYIPHNRHSIQLHLTRLKMATSIQSGAVYRIISKASSNLGLELSNGPRQ
jgi:hypothetical protein